VTPPLPRTRYCSRCLTTFGGAPDRCPNLGCRCAPPPNGWGELLDTGDLIDRTYRIHRRLAIGGAGVTYLVRETAEDGSDHGPLLAVKVLYQQRDQGPYLRRLATEAQILQGLNHPQIVEYRGFVHRSGHSPYLVTRFEQGGSLLDHLRQHGTLPIQAVANIGRQVCWALEVAHRQGVVHRDLKPENVLLVKSVERDAVPELKVADFGIAKVVGGFGDRLTRVGAFVGTPQYAAPEQFDGLTPEPAADVYALGALMHFCLTLRPIAEFPDQIDAETCRDLLVAALPPRLDLPDAAPDQRRWMADTLAMAMALEPQDRCAVSALDERLAAIAAGRDPGPPRLPPSSGTPHQDLDTPLRPTSTADIAYVSSPSHTPGTPPARATRPPRRTAGASLGGLAVEPPPPPPPPPKVRTTAADKRVVASSDGGLRPPPTRTLTLDTLPEPSRRTMGCGLVGALGFTAAVLVGFVGWLALTQEHILATRLGPNETDTVRREDWTRVAGTLGERGVAAETACQAANPNARYLYVTAIVDGGGTVRRVELPNYAYEPTRLCMERELQRAPFPRVGHETVEVTVALQK
jgi:serine/threonine protein kinase